jgi:hypothetical protein
LKHGGSLLDSIKRWNEKRKDRDLAIELLRNVVKLKLSGTSDSEIRKLIAKEIDIDKIQLGIINKMKRVPELKLLFPYLLKMPWDKAVEDFSTLKGKSYEDIKSFHEKIATWGNISSQDVRPMTGLAFLNLEVKSPELELFLIYLLFIND